MSDYISDKELIFNFQHKDDWLILNYENKFLEGFFDEVCSKLVIRERGIEYYNDTIATIPEARISALKFFKGKK